MSFAEGHRLCVNRQKLCGYLYGAVSHSVIENCEPITIEKQSLSAEYMLITYSKTKVTL